MMPNGRAPSPWWSKERHADRRGLLIARERIKTAIRAWFNEQGFVEVDTGCLVVSPGNETHLAAFRTEIAGPGGARRPLYLRTSPEFACKKLLAAGERKVFTFAPSFRNGERGALHAPEFTMLEWYRAEEPYERVMDDALALVHLAARETGARLVSWRGAVAAPAATPERLTVADAFSRHAGIDLAAALAGNDGDRDRLAADLTAAGISARDGDDWGDLFSRALAALIEPKLGIGAPTLLTEYPAREAALSRPAPRDARFGERFELYLCGVELANGYGELTDAGVQRANLERQMDERQRRYGERYPIDEDFIAALDHMPPASGCALGFDRLVMLATGAPRIDDVIWTPLPDLAGGGA